jgi:hypothetical protein
MPRLTNDLYLERHGFLRKAWHDFYDIFSVLPVTQQWELHRYYQSQSGRAPAELLRRRAEMTEAEPSLPNRAGKSFSRVYRAFRHAFEYAQGDEQRFFRAVVAQIPEASITRHYVPATSTAPARVIKVWSVARPEPDLQKLVLALKLLAEQQAREQPGDASHDEAA